MKKKYQVYILLNEVSGDLQTASLIRNLKRYYPGEFEFQGVCGDHCRAEGVRVLYDMTHRSAIGIEETLKNFIFYLIAFFRSLLFLWRNPVDLLICVDSSAFNLPFNYLVKKVLAKRFKRFASIKSAYYIPPHVTLMGESQIRMLRHFDKQLYTFKMDYDLAKTYLDNAEFVGHSFSSLERNYDKEAVKVSLGLNPQKKVLTLFPGSRFLEINGLLDVYLDAAGRLKKDYGDDLEISLSLAHERFSGLVREKIAKKNLLDVKIVLGRPDDVMKGSDFCLCAAGTATLQGVLYKIPMAVCYVFSPFFYYLAKRGLFLCPFFAMPNILLGEEVVHEFLNEDCTPENVYAYAKTVMQDAKYMDYYAPKADLAAEKLHREDAEAFTANTLYRLVEPS